MRRQDGRRPAESSWYSFSIAFAIFAIFALGCEVKRPPSPFPTPEEDMAAVAYAIAAAECSRYITLQERGAAEQGLVALYATCRFSEPSAYDYMLQSQVPWVGLTWYALQMAFGPIETQEEWLRLTHKYLCKTIRGCAEGLGIGEGI